jgi:hypothetical protein
MKQAATPSGPGRRIRWGPDPGGARRRAEGPRQAASRVAGPALVQVPGGGTR